MKLTRFQKRVYIWLIGFTVFCIVNTVLVMHYKLYGDFGIAILFPAIHAAIFLVSKSIYYILSSMRYANDCRNKPPYEKYKEYIRDYYPALFKTLYAGTWMRQDIVFYQFISHDLDDGTDEYLQRIKNYYKTNVFYTLWVFGLLLLVLVLSIGKY